MAGPLRFQFRRDTSGNWTSADPILLSGEFGLETDTLKFKFGDGSTAWTSLPYPSAGPAETPVDNEVVSGSGTAWTLANTPAVGCVPILFTIIPGFGGIALVEGSVAAYGYSITGANITTVSSYSAGALRAWYRY